MNTIAVVQARYGSSRLRGKALRPIAGRPMLAHVLMRAKAIRGITQTVLATTDQERDTPLTWIAYECDVPCIRGSEHDVLDRFVMASEAFHADAIIRITGDCPLVAPDACEAVVREFNAMDRDADVKSLVEYVANETTDSGYPDGIGCEMFSARLLNEANGRVPALNGRRSHENADTRDREHVTAWMRRTQPQRIVHADEDWRHLKLSVDSDADLERVRRVFGFLRDGDFSLASTIAAWQLAYGFD